MKSITCPKCRSHISEWDVICLNCGFTITPEERELLVKEQEKQSSDDSFIGSSPHVRVLKHQHSHKIQKKLNEISFGLFKVGWAELSVPIIIFLLIIIFIILMII